MTQTATQTAAPATSTVSSDQNVVACRGLTKVFKDFWLRNRVTAVNDVDLTIRRGEVFGLLGPNGSGKSTTIKIILGLLHATRGRAVVFGHPPQDVEIKKRVGYLPEESYLYRFLNPRETLDYYGRLFHQNASQRRKRIDMLLDMVGLTHAQRRPVGEFSKGMQRKVGLAQALINDPELLILDEPTTGMDPLATADVKRLIHTLKQRGKTVLLCSHLLADVEDVCDRVAIMFGGKVRQQGTVEELLTSEERTTLTTGDLEQADIDAIEQALVARGKHLDRVDRPRRRLEDLFLEIVESAKSEGLRTSGAESGGRIAEFLAEGGDASIASEEPGGEALVSSLLAAGESDSQERAAGAKKAVEPAAEPAPEPASKRAEGEAQHEREEIDSLLADESVPSSQPQAAPPEPSPKQEREDADRSVIDNLLGGEEKQDKR
ncbi:MAG: ABC transporter ATP-binding protein [Phycisphaeraceae bacterium]